MMLFVVKDLESVDVQQRASRLIRAAGRRCLVPLGVSQRGRSGRHWIADQGWWLINIEFQPSSFAVGAYLNVGLQHLWVRKDYMVFEYSSRQTIEGYDQYVDLGGDNESTVAAVDALAMSAKFATEAWLIDFADDTYHYRWLTEHNDGLWNGVNAAFACAALGDQRGAARAFNDVARRIDRRYAWQAELGQACEQLAQLSARPDVFRAETDRRIQAARRLLKLQPS